MIGQHASRKLRSPGLSPWVVNRPRIDQLLQDCFDRVDVVEIAASPGAGKTVAAQQFAVRRGAPTAWLNLDAADRSGARLLTYLDRALEPFSAQPHVVIGEALRSGVSIAQCAAGLAERALDGELLIVFDNCECLDPKSDADNVLTTFLTYLPPTARVLLLTRERMDPVINRLRLDGRVACLEDDDLAFDLEEARLLLTSAGNSPERAADLLVSTRGWAAGIVFDAEVPADRRRGDFAHYLNQELLERLTPEEQHFLLRTSLLEKVTRSGAIELCGEAGPALLSRISRLRLPATTEPEGGLVYHPCFREFLNEQLYQRLPEEALQLRQRYAAVLAEQGTWAEAIELLFGIDDLDGAAELVIRSLPAVLGRGEWGSVLRWLDRLGSVSRQRHAPLIAAEIRCLTRTRRFVDAQAIVRDLLRTDRLDPVIDADPTLVADIGWAFLAHPVEGLAIIQRYPTDHRAEAIRYVLRVISGHSHCRPPPGHDFGDVARILAWGLFLQGRFDLLARFGHPVGGGPSTAGRPDAPPTMLTMVWRGQHELARALWDQLPHDENGLSDHIEAWIYMAEGNWPAALRAAEESVARSERTQFGWGPYLQLLVGFGLIRAGRLTEARSVLADARTRAEAAGQVAYVEWTSMYQGLAQLLGGASGAAVETFRQCLDSIQASGRRLLAPAVYAYLSEAEARRGATGRAAKLAMSAARTAEETSSWFLLEQALIDVPLVADRLGRSSGNRPPGMAHHPAGPSSAAERAHHVEVRPFGPRPDLWVDGAPAGIRRLKVIELAAFLAAHDGIAARQQMQLALFPDHEQRTGSNYFRQITHQFRRTTGIPLVRWDADTIGLPAGCVLTAVDVEFERAAAAAANHDDAGASLVALAEEIDGDYLAASVLSWAESRRFELSVLLADARQAAAATAFAAGSWETAERLAERALDVDPFCEPAFGVLLALTEGDPARRDVIVKRAQQRLAEIYADADEVDQVLGRLQCGRSSTSPTRATPWPP